MRQDRPERGYKGFVPPEPMFQLQVDLADMTAFAQGPYKYMLVAIDAFSKKLTAVPMANKEASTAAGAWDKVVKDLGIPLNVYSDDGSEFKKEFKQKLDYFDVDKIVSRGHATMAERAIRTLKEALVRRLTAGVGRRNQWHLLLPNIIAIEDGGPWGHFISSIPPLGFARLLRIAPSIPPLGPQASPGILPAGPSLLEKSKDALGTLGSS